MKKMMMVLPLAAAAMAMTVQGAPCCEKACCKAKAAEFTARQDIDPVIGNWSAKLPYADMNAASLIFSRDENGVAKAFVLLRWASPVWCVDVKVEKDSFSLRHAQHKALIRGKVSGDKLLAEIANCDKDGKQTKTRVDIIKMGRDGRVDMDMQLKAGDVIYVPMSWY